MSEQPLKIIFAGTPEFAATTLQMLLGSEQHVVAVYTQPDRPAGRGRRLIASPVKQLAIQAQRPVMQPPTLRDITVQQTLASLQADLMVVVAYGLILPAAVLAIPRLGCINVHASLLPRWRGAAPIQRAILAGDKETGITTMQMDAGLDTGDILLQRRCPINSRDTAGNLHDRLATLGAETLLETLILLQQGRLQARPQDDDKASYADKLSKREACIDWSLPAELLERQVRAFNPWPVSYTTLADGRRLRIWQAQLCHQDEVSAIAGTVVKQTANGIDVATGDGCLSLQTVQLPGARPVSIADFINATPLQLGDVLGGCDEAGTPAAKHS